MSPSPWLESHQSLGAITHFGRRHDLATTELARVAEDLALVEVATRRATPGMVPGRADVIVAGGLIALALLEHWGAQSVRISDRGVRWGLAEDLSR